MKVTKAVMLRFCMSSPILRMNKNTMMNQMLRIERTTE